MLITGRDAVLAAAGDTPYTRAHTAGGEVVGYHEGGPGAIKLYRRLGFTEGLQRISLQL